MQKAGILFAVLALVLVQVPIVLCHSDCHAAALPLWALNGHHCHEVEAASGHDDGIGRCPGHGHPEGAAPCDSHPPGIHELAVTAGARTPSAPSVQPLPAPAQGAPGSTAAVCEGQEGCRTALPDVPAPLPFDARGIRLLV